MNMDPKGKWGWWVAGDGPAELRGSPGVPLVLGVEHGRLVTLGRNGRLDPIVLGHPIARQIVAEHDLAVATADQAACTQELENHTADCHACLSSIDEEPCGDAASLASRLVASINRQNAALDRYNAIIRAREGD